MKRILIIAFTIIIVGIVATCVKTEVINAPLLAPVTDTALYKMPRTFTPRDTTDTMRHEITFGPTVIGWEVVDIDVEIK